MHVDDLEARDGGLEGRHGLHRLRIGGGIFAETDQHLAVRCEDADTGPVGRARQHLAQQHAEDLSPFALGGKGIERQRLDRLGERLGIHRMLEEPSVDLLGAKAGDGGLRAQLLVAEEGARLVDEEIAHARQRQDEGHKHERQKTAVLAKFLVEGGSRVGQRLREAQVPDSEDDEDGGDGETQQDPGRCQEGQIQAQARDAAGRIGRGDPRRGEADGDEYRAREQEKPARAQDVERLPYGSLPGHEALLFVVLLGA